MSSIKQLERDVIAQITAAFKDMKASPLQLHARKLTLGLDLNRWVRCCSEVEETAKELTAIGWEEFTKQFPLTDPARYFKHPTYPNIHLKLEKEVVNSFLKDTPSYILMQETFLVRSEFSLARRVVRPKLKRVRV